LSLIEIVVLSIVLGIDCLVVSFSQGLIFKSNRIKNSLLLACSMGFFQGLFPCLGYAGTVAISKFIEPFGHILVCAIFSILGIKFIVEAFQKEKEEVCCIGFKCLVGLGIAVSIDAFASGVTLKLTSTPLLLSAIIIAFGSFIMSLFGFYSGIFFKQLPSKFLEITGGIILLFLAIRACLS
jgi:putative Mn2+ efflux pump MntP